MKVCVLNFSGNVGKSTIAAHLLQPRLNAQVFSVESLNVDASSDGLEVARLRGKHYNDLLQRLMKLDDAIVDVGSSNVEDFLKMMQHYADSQEEFDLFVVPVVKDGKQQADTVNTIRALRAIGVPAAKILVLINKVETDDDLRTDFAGVFGFCASGEATIPEGGVIFANVESLNVDASSDGLEVARLRGKHYNDLLQRLMKLDDAIVDVGSSNVEDFLKMMQHYADSQEEFDLFVVPVVKDGKQQADTVNTIRALRAIGVPAAKILVLINKVETDDDLRTDFAGVFGFCASGEATIPEGGVIFANELFAMLKTQQLSIGALNDDATDYRQRLRVAANEDEQDAAIQMIAMKRLAKTCNKNLDTAFAALFPETLQASLALPVAA